MKNFKTQLLLLLSLFIVSLAISCKKEADLGGDIAYVAVYNAIPAATGLTFYIDSKPINGTTTLLFGGNTGYAGVYQGTYSSQTVIAGSSTSLAPVSVSFEGKVSRSLFLTGTPTAVGYFWITDDITQVNADKPKVRFLNMSSDAGTLILEVQLLGTKTTFSDRAYQQFTGYTELTAGTEYTINLIDKATNASVATTIRATFVKGKLYTIWAKGLKGATVDGQQLALQVSLQN